MSFVDHIAEKVKSWVRGYHKSADIGAKLFVDGGMTKLGIFAFLCLSVFLNR